MKKILVVVFLFVSFFFTANFLEVSAASNFSVQVGTHLDEASENTALPAPALTELSRGQKVSFNASGISSDYSFAFYIVNGIINENLPQNYQFTVRKDLTISAVFYPNGSSTPEDARHVVVFADSNGLVLDLEYVQNGGTAVDTEATAEINVKPNSVLAANKWATADGLTTSLENITGNRIYYVQYELSGSFDQVQLTVVDSPGTALYDYNELVTLTANPTKDLANFSHWENSKGHVVSYNPSYSFTILSATTLTAVYGSSTPEPVVSMSDDLNLRSGYNSYMGQFSLPTGYSLVEYGFIFSRSSDVLTLESLGATILPSNVHHGLSKEFLRSFPDDTFNSIRAYLIVMNQSSVEEVYYSENMFGAPVVSEQVIYQTGFEAAEGFSSSSVYNNTTPALLGPTGNQWGIYYGTTATTDAIIGSQSAQMRWYTTATANLGYMRSQFTFSNVTKVEFYAENTNNLRVSVSYSTDGSTWLGQEMFMLTSTSTLYTFNVNVMSSIYLRFDLTLPDPIPGGTSRLYIDDIKVFGQTGSSQHEIIYDVDGVLSEEMIVNNSIVSYSPSKVGHTFDGWYFDNLFEEPYGNSPIIQSQTLHAKFTPNNYTLAFDSNGGSSITTLNQAFGTEVLAPSNPTREGYDFVGWYEDNGTFETPYVFDTMPAFNDTIYAKWELNDLGKAMADADALSQPTTITEATTLTLLAVGSTYSSSISWSSSHPDIISATNGAVVLPDETTNVTLTATVTYNGTSINKDFVINVVSSGAVPDPQTYMENFSGITITGSSYGSGSFTGVNSQLWEHTDSRGDQTLDGKALLLRNGSLTTTFSDGLSNIKFDYRRAFTGTNARSYEVYINGVLIDTITVVANADTRGTYDSGVLNYTGTVSLEIKGIGAQKLIDNLYWTTNPSNP